MSQSADLTENIGLVRPMERHDRAVVFAMVARLARLHSDESMLDHARLEADLFGPAPMVRGLVAQRFGFVVGYALLAPRPTAQDAPRALDIEQLFVMEGSRGLGLGGLLVEAALHHARGAACAFLRAGSHHENSRVQDLYRAFGFQPREAGGRDLAVAL